ncbi:hypothetical protein LUZ60_005076 [Juncus effusus]|nr:hypothetical protein LUZ60_005076 [Juncus effusus]
MAVEARHFHLLQNRSDDTFDTSNQIMAITNLNSSSIARKRPRETPPSICDNISVQIHQQMLEIDHLILNQMQRARIEFAERRQRYINQLSFAIQNGIAKRMKAKDEEIERITEINRGLEERIKNLALETQLWRELAQSHETTASMLRFNLEQVLNHREEEKQRAFHDDAEESCCSNGDKDLDEDRNDRTRIRVCKNCLEKETSVLILPCRHLCLCDSCGVDPTVIICPACGEDRTGVFKVNLV